MKPLVSAAVTATFLIATGALAQSPAEITPDMKGLSDKYNKGILTGCNTFGGSQSILAPLRLSLQVTNRPLTLAVHTTGDPQSGFEIEAHDFPTFERLLASRIAHDTWYFPQPFQRLANFTITAVRYSGLPGIPPVPYDQHSLQLLSCSNGVQVGFSANQAGIRNLKLTIDIVGATSEEPKIVGGWVVVR